jgi:hypothetical protein
LNATLPDVNNNKVNGNSQLLIALLTETDMFPTNVTRMKNLSQIMSLYRDSKVRVWLEDLYSQDVSVTVGVLAGDTLAQYLFILVLDYAMRKRMNTNLGFVLNEEKRISSRRTIPSLVLTDLDFADDIALLSSTFANAQNLLNNLLREVKFIGLSLNIDKTKYLLGGQ